MPQNDNYLILIYIPFASVSLRENYGVKVSFSIRLAFFAASGRAGFRIKSGMTKKEKATFYGFINLKYLSFKMIFNCNDHQKCNALDVQGWTFNPHSCLRATIGSTLAARAAG